MDCKVCGKTGEKKPMAFRGEEYCSDIHRKMLKGELPIATATTEMTEAGLQVNVTKLPTTNENSVVE